ncbi:50S ribosomal protein L10 [Acidiferrimicrobium sp. IK]|uniref:50S ribosomal protein L10 n=1 Tax=Acidiferrimicrobium sp. IK TaxID=2871700 RepID=UPI0021CAE3CD|nr:50S ribosomal protein L10 [Acidiferrimicrobium sp. IK]MCU4183347.1 50S ribosomal protein L10 [Acidiferrimicrobium sp. IK]
MDNPRAEKVAVVDEVRQHFDEADAAILTEYRGLKVKELADLRRSLAPAGGEYRVYKNTLVRFAARDAGLGDLEPLLEGPTGIAFVKGDAAAVAKSLRDYARTQPLLIIKGGVLGDKVLTPAETTALADLPSREVLLARFAGALAAPMQQLAGLLQALPRNLAYGLAALRDQKVANGEGGAPDAAAEPDAAGEAAEGSTDAGAVAAEPAEAAAEAAAADAESSAATLDDAESPVLAAEAVDPTPPE